MQIRMRYHSNYLDKCPYMNITCIKRDMSAVHDRNNLFRMIALLLDELL